MSVSGADILYCSYQCFWLQFSTSESEETAKHQQKKWKQMSKSCNNSGKYELRLKAVICFLPFAEWHHIPTHEKSSLNQLISCLMLRNTAVLHHQLSKKMTLPWHFSYARGFCWYFKIKSAFAQTILFYNWKSFLTEYVLCLCEHVLSLRSLHCKLLWHTRPVQVGFLGPSEGCTTLPTLLHTVFPTEG